MSSFVASAPIRPSTSQFSYQMPNGFRNSQISCGSVISRFSSWTRMRAISNSSLAGSKLAPGDLGNAIRFQFAGQDHSPGDTLEQELKNLDMSAGLFEVAAPSIKAVAPNQVA